MAVNGLKTSGDGNVVIKDILSQLLQCNHVIGNQCFQDIVIVFPVSFALYRSIEQEPDAFTLHTSDGQRKNTQLPSIRFR